MPIWFLVICNYAGDASPSVHVRATPVINSILNMRTYVVYTRLWMKFVLFILPFQNGTVYLYRNRVLQDIRPFFQFVSGFPNQLDAAFTYGSKTFFVKGTWNTHLIKWDAEFAKSRKGVICRHKSAKLWKRAKILHEYACFHPSLHTLDLRRVLKYSFQIKRNEK